MALKVGAKAPNFKLFSSDKEEVSLSDFKGKGNVVLLFFPLAFSGGCTTELCSTRDALATYNKLDAQVIGISVDSFATLAKFKAAEKGNFPFLSDFNKTTIEAYDVVNNDFILGMKGVAQRASFVIDINGIIQFVDVVLPSEQPNFDAIKVALENLN